MRENRRTVMFVGVLTTTVVLLLVVFVWGVTLYRQNTHSVHGESAAPLLSDSSIPSPTEVKMRWASFEDRYDERARVTAEKDREFTEFGWPAARVIPKDETNETHL